MKNDHTHWDEKLSFISCALRNTHHQSINTSPYHALFGLDMVTHGSTYAVLRRLKILDEPSYKLSHDDNLQLIRQELQKSMKKAYEQNQYYYNLRTRPQAFQVGQQVYRRNFAQSSTEKKFNAKFAPLFVKAEIKEKLGSHYYMLQDMDGKAVGTYHAKDLRM